VCQDVGKVGKMVVLVSSFIVSKRLPEVGIQIFKIIKEK
jgi:hypothetical protein